MPRGIKTGPTPWVTSWNQRNRDVESICGENDSGERSRAIIALLLCNVFIRFVFQGSFGKGLKCNSTVKLIKRLWQMLSFSALTLLKFFLFANGTSKYWFWILRCGEVFVAFFPQYKENQSELLYIKERNYLFHYCYYPSSWVFMCVFLYVCVLHCI